MLLLPKMHQLLVGGQSKIQFRGATRTPDGGSPSSMPANLTGDLLINVVMDASGTLTTPSGWAQNGAGGGSLGWAVFSKIATQDNEPAASFGASASHVVHAYSGARRVRNVSGNTGSGSTITYNALSTFDSGGKNWVMLAARMLSASGSIDQPPNALVISRGASTGPGVECVGHDSNGGISSWALANQAVGVSAAWQAIALEIESA